MLAVLQKFDPPGVCARNLSECLAIQLRELDRFDPAMRALVEHLDLLAKRDIGALRKLCGVDDDDIRLELAHDAAQGGRRHQVDVGHQVKPSDDGEAGQRAGELHGHGADAAARDERPDGAWHAEWPTLQRLLVLAVTAVGLGIALYAEWRTGVRVMGGALVFAAGALIGGG